MSEATPDSHLKRRRRWLRIAAWAVAAVLLVLYVGYPVAMGVAAVWPSRAAVTLKPAGFERVTFTRSDGVKLVAWYAPPGNGAAIVVTHEAGESRARMLSRSQMLAGDGYGVLVLDMSGHGESGGRTNRFAWQGTDDVSAAVDYLARQPGVEHIGAYGVSMGGEAVLGASAACPRIEAIVADGATCRSLEELKALPSERSLVRTFVPSVTYATVGLLTGQDPPAPLLGEMERTKDTRFLLIAAGDEAREVEYNRYFAEVLGDRAQLWVAPGVEHTWAFARYPSQYERRVIGFFNEAFNIASTWN